MNIESLNTSLVDNLTTAIIVLDGHLRLRHLNPAAETLLETSKRHCHLQKIAELFRDAGELPDSLRNVQKDGSTFIGRKIQWELANGNKLVVDYAISPLHDLGEYALLVEIQGLDRAYQISRKELFLSSHETTQELVRGLGHEIKNPLGGIRGAAQLLAAELNDPDLQDYTNIIIGEADRLVKLVDRLTGGYQHASLAMMNIHQVLERVRQVVEAEAQGKVTIVRDYDPSIPEFMGDVEQLIQAALNIVRNAMQALTECDMQGAKPRIILRTRTMSHLTIGSTVHKLVARIEIIDNGPGIDPNLIDTIFFPMISGRAEGTGLGLSIAQTIVANHGGLIECESHPGRTNFIISIPLQAEGKSS